MQPYHKRKLTLVDKPFPLRPGQVLVLYHEGVPLDYVIAVCSVAERTGIEMVIATRDGAAVLLTGASTTYMYIENDNDVKARNWDKTGFAEYDGELYSLSLMADTQSIAFWMPAELGVPRPVVQYDHIVSTDGVTWIVEHVTASGNIMMKRERDVCSRTLCPTDQAGAEYFNIEYR